MPPAKEVGDVGGEEEDGEAAEAGEGAEEAETGACGVVENWQVLEEMVYGMGFGVMKFEGAEPLERGDNRRCEVCGSLKILA